jgi:hypothetical protein
VASRATIHRPRTDEEGRPLAEWEVISWGQGKRSRCPEGFEGRGGLRLAVGRVRASYSSHLARCSSHCPLDLTTEGDRGRLCVGLSGRGFLSFQGLSSQTPNSLGERLGAGCGSGGGKTGAPGQTFLYQESVAPEMATRWCLYSTSGEA